MASKEIEEFWGVFAETVKNRLTGYPMLPMYDTRDKHVRPARLLYERLRWHCPALAKRALQRVDPQNSEWQLDERDWLKIIGCDAVMARLLELNGGVRQMLIAHGCKTQSQEKNSDGTDFWMYSPILVGEGMASLFKKFGKMKCVQFFDVRRGAIMLFDVDDEPLVFCLGESDNRGHTGVCDNEWLARALWYGAGDKSKTEEERTAWWKLINNTINAFIDQEIAELAEEQQQPAAV